MNTIRSVVFSAVAGFALFAVLLLTASLGLALAAIAAVMVATGAIAHKLAPKPVPVRTSSTSRRSNPMREPRVWNDGRGTIIDL